MLDVVLILRDTQNSITLLDVVFSLRDAQNNMFLDVVLSLRDTENDIVFLDAVLSLRDTQNNIMFLGVVLSLRDQVGNHKPTRKKACIQKQTEGKGIKQRWGGDVAQLVERRTGTPLRQVRFPGAAKDLSRMVNFQCRLFYGVHAPPLALTSVCT